MGKKINGSRGAAAEGCVKMETLVLGKSTDLAEMGRLLLPLPSAFASSTGLDGADPRLACDSYRRFNSMYGDGVEHHLFEDIHGEAKDGRRPHPLWRHDAPRGRRRQRHEHPCVFGAGELHKAADGRRDDDHDMQGVDARPRPYGPPGGAALELRPPRRHRRQAYEIQQRIRQRTWS